MTTAARAEMPRSPVFNAVTAGLLLVSVLWVMLTIATPESPVDMMVPWLRTANLAQALLGAACVALIWNRKGWAFYVWVGLVMLGVLIGLLLHYAIPFLLIGPGLLVIYLWALHDGGVHSMWRQMFGAPGMPGRGMAYGPGPAMPPPLPGAARPPMPPAPPRASAPPPPTAPMPPVAPQAAALDPLEALKRLGTLRDSGALTEAEFAAKKAEILKRL